MPSARKLVRKLVPSRLTCQWSILRAKAQLAQVAVADCDAGVLSSIEAVDLASLFRSAEHDQEWVRIEREMAALAISGEGHGVNPGDRRAIYQLVRHLRPASVLEVGTHIGASTVHIAAALKFPAPARPVRLTTVDIRDVNDPVAKPWTRFGCRLSPQEKITRLGCSDFVRFVASDSLTYLRQCCERYDLVFLDGDHSATRVYQEIAASLGLLNPGGWMLLHDFFPRMKPLWSNGVMQPGPCLATLRLRREGHPLKVVPLGRLPWTTKLDSSVTSLALLGRQAKRAA